MTNGYLKAAIDNAYSDKKFIGDLKMKVTEDLSDIVMIKKFFRTWAESNYTNAIAGLPDDDPGTRHNEEVTEEEFKKRASRFFEKPWDQILNENKTNADLINSIQQLAGKIRLYVVRQASLRNEQDYYQSRIDNLRSIERQDFSTPDEGE